MKPDSRPTSNATPSASGDLVRQRRWALVAAVVGAVALGAMLGHGIAQSLLRSWPAGWTAGLGAAIGGFVAALLVPLSGWAAIRLVQPTLSARTESATVTRLRPAVAPTPRVVPTAPYASTATAPSGSAPQANAQAPARDALTGAYTQQHFVAAADREWSRNRRHGEDAALLMVDVDHFKRLNDEFGTACGDAMLVEITRQASSTLRPYDLLARFGGGVLVVYLPHTDPLGALDVAERIRERVAGLRLAWEGKSVKATVSVGVSGVGLSHQALDGVIADAGNALREAKSAGRNCVRSAPIPPRHNDEPKARSAN